MPVSRRIGRVSIVGAGPGDPMLLTLKAVEVLKSCDVVVHDHLIAPGVLDFAARAKKMRAGKRPAGERSMSQKTIDALLIRLARAGKCVARLKNGDPFVFGRGGEEALALAKAGIPFEIVPGISAGTGVPAYAGIPLTHRGLSSEVTFLTAHEAASRSRSKIDWEKIASLKGTIVVFMRFKMLERTCRRFVKWGRSTATRVTVIEWGTTERQKVVSGTLQTIAACVRRANVTAPITVVIGAVNDLRTSLDWFQPKPLLGKSVLVTRPRAQAASLKEALELKGACVFCLPTIEISKPCDPRPLDQAIESLSDFDWVVFTSANGVEGFFKRLKKLGKARRALSGLRIASIGPATSQRLRFYGISPDLVPPVFTTASLAAHFKKSRLRGKKLLFLRADIASEELRLELQKEGALVTEAAVYETRRPAHLKRDLERLMRGPGRPDYITFTSASTAASFYETLPKSRSLEAKVISIGPVTSKAVRRHGGTVSREAGEATVEGIVNAILEEEYRGIPKR